MDLLPVSIVLVVVGFFVCLLGSWMVSREGGAAAATSLPELIQEAIRKMFTAVGMITSTSTSLGQKVQGLGSFLTWAGLVVFIVWVIGQINPSQGGGDNGGASPSAS